MLASLSGLLRVLSLSASAPPLHTEPSTSRVSRTPEVTLIDGRLFHKHSLLPVEDFCNEDANSESRQKLLKEALESSLITPLIEIIADYINDRSRQFAEDLYAELWAGKTDLLDNELYSFGVLKERHHFWDYLSERASPVVAFVHMLLRTGEKHPELKKRLTSFAALVAKKVPQTAYFVAHYLVGDNMSLPLSNISFDEWPQALAEDQDSSKQCDLLSGTLWESFTTC